MKQIAKVSISVAIGVYFGMIAASVTLVWIDYAMWGAP